MKVYVHNFFTEELFIIIAHNSTNRVYNVYKSHNKNQKIGSVFCDYKGTSFDFVFNPELNDNTDGIHLIDFFSIKCWHYSANALGLPGCIDAGDSHFFNMDVD